MFTKIHGAPVPCSPLLPEMEKQCLSLEAKVILKHLLIDKGSSCFSGSGLLWL